MTDPIAQFIPTTTNLFEDDPSGQTERKARNIVRTEEGRTRAVQSVPAGRVQSERGGVSSGAGARGGTDHDEDFDAEERFGVREGPSWVARWLMMPLNIVIVTLSWSVVARRAPLQDPS